VKSWAAEKLISPMDGFYRSTTFLTGVGGSAKANPKLDDNLAKQFIIRFITDGEGQIING
jgi:hypothetical protein